MIMCFRITYRFSKGNFELASYNILLGSKRNKLTSEKIEGWVEHLRSKLNVLELKDLHIALETLYALRSRPEVSSILLEVFDVTLKKVASSEKSSDPTLLYHLKAFDEKVRLSPAQIQIALEILSSIKYTSDPETYFKGYQSLVHLNSLKAAPHSLYLQSTVFGVDENIILRLRAVDLLDGEIPILSSRLVSLKKVGKDISTLQSTPVEGGIDLTRSNLIAGRYVSTFEIHFSEGEAPIKFQSPLLLRDRVHAISVRAGVSTSKDASQDDLFDVKNDKFFGKASASALEVLHVVVKLSRKGRIHQGTLKFTSAQSGLNVLFNLSGEESVDGQFDFNIRFGDEVEKFAYQSGTYLLSFLAGDLSLSEPLEVDVGSIQLSFPLKPVANLPLYSKALLYSSDITLQKLPEIEHQMRSPAKRASKPTSILFTALIFLPLGALLVGLLNLRPNLRRLSSISSIVASALFSALLMLYAGYWIGVKGMSFYETIKYLCFIYPALAFFARSSLISVMAKRLQESKSKAISS